MNDSSKPPSSSKKPRPTPICPPPDVPEQIIIRRRHVAGSDHVGFDPVRVGLPAGEHVPQRADSVPDRRGVHPIHFHLSVKPRRHRVADRVVPTGVGRQTLRLRQHVAVEKDEDVVRGKPRARVASPGQPEAAALLPSHPYVQRRPGGLFERDPRSVVDDDYLELIRGKGLTLQRRQRQRQRLRGFVVRHDYTNRPGRSKGISRDDVQLVPVVVPDCHRWRHQRHKGCSGDVPCSREGERQRIVLIRTLLRGGVSTSRASSARSRLRTATSSSSVRHPALRLSHSSRASCRTTCTLPAHVLRGWSSWISWQRRSRCARHEQVSDHGWVLRKREDR